ncbi:hypothetical protein GCM10027346_36340 [Hymenobacter seoulensis]
MRKIAQEVGLSKAAVIWKTNWDGIYAIRYFPLKQQIACCGPTILAVASLLFTQTPHTVTYFSTPSWSS